MSDYLVMFNDLFNPKICTIRNRPEEMPAIHRPACGLPLGSAYDAPITFRMSPRFGTKRVTDCLANTFGYLMVSSRMKVVLEATAKGAIEYLPFRLADQKGVLVDGEFHIANVLEIQDCVDLEQSTYVDDPMQEGRFQFMSRLVLDPEKVDGTATIFRIRPMPEIIVVHRDLAAAIQKEKLTGIVFYEMGEPLPF